MTLLAKIVPSKENLHFVCVERDPDAKEGTGGMSEDDAVGPVGSHACELSAELSWWRITRLGVGRKEEWCENLPWEIHNDPQKENSLPWEVPRIPRRKVPRNRSQALSRLQG